MCAIRYMISEASKKIEVEQHTLRYWEEELEIHILRNELGHRYYRAEDIEVFKAVKALKEKGYQLRAIKMILPDIQKQHNFDIDELAKIQQDWDIRYSDVVTGGNNLSAIPVQHVSMLEDEQDMLLEKSTDKMEQFKTIMGRLVANALHDNNTELSKAVSTSVIKEMDYLLRMKEDREEERYKQIDRTIREVQSSRGEYATARVRKTERKKGLFHKSIKKPMH